MNYFNEPTSHLHETVLSFVLGLVCIAVPMSGLVYLSVESFERWKGEQAVLWEEQRELERRGELGDCRMFVRNNMWLVDLVSCFFLRRSFLLSPPFRVPLSQSVSDDDDDANYVLLSYRWMTTLYEGSFIVHPYPIKHEHG